MLNQAMLTIASDAEGASDVDYNDRFARIDRASSHSSATLSTRLRPSRERDQRAACRRKFASHV
jgi:hypothetical protein